jgi:hypothetical protein
MIIDIVAFFLLLWIFVGVWMLGAGSTPLGNWVDWTLFLWWMVFLRIKKMFTKEVTGPITYERLRDAREYREKSDRGDL